jgi:hypothetical protein
MGHTMPYYKPEDLAKLQENLGTIAYKYDRLLLAFSYHHRFKKENTWEYANHGFMRRVGTLRRCIENVFNLIPPATEERPDRNVLHDAQINVQSFFANVYGSLDNLAWIWVYERELESIGRKRVGLRVQNTELRATFSEAFQEYLKSRDGWMDHVIEYRDALAHRIPLYIPPGTVQPRNVDAYNDLSVRIREVLYVRPNPPEYDRLSAEQEGLLVFQPVITHSVRETTAYFPFHAQMIADFLTVEEFGYKMLEELKRKEAS